MYTRVSQIPSKLRNNFNEYARTFYAYDFWSLYLIDKKQFLSILTMQNYMNNNQWKMTETAWELLQIPHSSYHPLSLEP